jgi:NAD(P)-dependent dehydrogenase (short-subunit alcohol dehydrogenase family)
MNHAGMSVNGPVEQVALADWGQLLGLNVLGMVRGLRVFLPDMLSRGAGHVVFTTSSLAPLAGHPHAAAAVPYITSKAAVVGLAQSVERYLAPHGIGVTLFAPDYTATAFPGSVRRVGAGGSGAEPVSAPVPYPAQPPEHAADSCWRRSTGARSSRRRPRGRTACCPCRHKAAWTRRHWPRATSP